MLRQQMKYGALATKVRAMYGKRLKKEDFAKLMDMKSIPEIASYLKQAPGWSEGLREFHSEGTNRAVLIGAIHRAEYNNYMKLFHFMSREDKEVMHFPVIAAEMEEVMAFMRLTAQGRSHEYNCTLPPFLRRESAIYYQELSEATTYEGLLSAVREADFRDALERIAPDDGSLPPYAQVEIIMQSYYYRTVYNSVQKAYGGKIRQLLIKSFGQQIDMINLIHVVRVRKYFGGMADNVNGYLLPIYFNLKPAFFKTLLEAKDDQAVDEQLRSSPYAKLFTNNTFSHIEEYYYRLMYEFHHHQISSGVPSILSAISYLLLKQIEVKNLINVIECVYYGVAPHQANVNLLLF